MWICLMGTFDTAWRKKYVVRFTRTSGTRQARDSLPWTFLGLARAAEPLGQTVPSVDDVIDDAAMLVAERWLRPDKECFTSDHGTGAYLAITPT